MVTELKADLRQLLQKNQELRTEHVRLYTGLKAVLDSTRILDNDPGISSSILEDRAGR